MKNGVWSWDFVWIRFEFLCCFWMFFHSWMCALLMCRQKTKLKTPWTWGTNLQELRCSLFIVGIDFIYIRPHSGPQERSAFCINGGVKMLSKVVELLTMVLVWNSFSGAVETIGAKTMKEFEDKEAGLHSVSVALVWSMRSLLYRNASGMDIAVWQCRGSLHRCIVVGGGQLHIWVYLTMILHARDDKTTHNWSLSSRIWVRQQEHIKHIC